jgi:hypothetical protein
MAAHHVASAIVLGIALSVAPVPADAGADFPVVVTVVGQGAIRLRLAAGRAAPCDSTANRMIFDGWVRVGSYVWTTSSDFVCYEHTSGALREADWSTAQLVPAVGHNGRGRTPPGPAEIRISTD